jgi:hypothetical protein
MGRVGRGQDRFIRRIPVILTWGCLEAGTGWDGLAGDRAGSYAESMSFSPEAAWRQGQDGTGWQGTGPIIRRTPVILTCGCLEAGTGWDGLAGDRTRSYAESLSFSPVAV